MSNPLLKNQSVLPGETFTLPSRGLFYDDSVLDAKNAEVHIRPMTSLDEIVMKTPDLLFSGEAVVQVFSRCIPQVLDAKKLLSKDVDFLLTCLRKISHGDELVVEHMHDCENAKKHNYQISVNSFIQNAKRIDPTKINKQFEVKIPSGETVKLQPIRYEDFITILQDMNKERDDTITPEQLAAELMNSIVNVIDNVDGVTNRDHIKEWLTILPPKHIRLIKEQVESSSDWGSDFDVEIKCKDCGKKLTISAPLNPLSFFS